MKAFFKMGVYYLLNGRHINPVKVFSGIRISNLSSHWLCYAQFQIVSVIQSCGFGIVDLQVRHVAALLLFKSKNIILVGKSYNFQKHKYCNVPCCLGISSVLTLILSSDLLLFCWKINSLFGKVIDASEWKAQAPVKSNRKTAFCDSSPSRD